MPVRQTRLVNYSKLGKEFNHGRQWSLGTFRKKVLERDNGVCKNCWNIVRDNLLKRRFRNEAHHIIPRRHGGKNTLANGITLCRFCHYYFGYCYHKYGLDYYNVIMKNSLRERVEHVNKLLKKQYLRHLLNIILYR